MLGVALGFGRRRRPARFRAEEAEAVTAADEPAETTYGNRIPLMNTLSAVMLGDGAKPFSPARATSSSRSYPPTKTNGFSARAIGGIGRRALTRQIGSAGTFVRSIAVGIGGC